MLLRDEYPALRPGVPPLARSSSQAAARQEGGITALPPVVARYWPSDREAVSLGHLETALDFEVRKVSEGSGEPAKCQKWPPSSPESATGQLPKCGNEASWAGGQNAQLRGHWARNEGFGTTACWALAAILMDQCADDIDFPTVTLRTCESSIIAEPVLIFFKMADTHRSDSHRLPP